MNIALTDDLRQLIRRSVETGQFPDEEAVVCEALKQFLVPESPQGRSQTGPAAEIPGGRLPGPFLEDETALVPIEVPRPGREIVSPPASIAARQPTLFPGE
jgi:hypothetical protein